MLARQVVSIDSRRLILTVAVGVGFFLTVAAFRIQKAIPLRSLLPILGMFLVFQLLTRRFRRTQLIRVDTGLIYT